MSCNTSFWTKGNCSGSIKQCNGCKSDYCNYHGVAVQACRAVGGHVCPNACDTTAIYVQNCAGANFHCPGCAYRFCAYHIAPVANIAQLVGGHVCKNTKGASIVNAFMQKTGLGDVDGYVKQLNALGHF